MPVQRGSQAADGRPLSPVHCTLHVVDGRLRVPTAVVFIHGLLSGPTTWDAFRTLISQDHDLEHFTTLAFAYPSPVAEPDPRRRIPDYDAIADALALFLERDTALFDQVILVTHSQG